MRKLFIILTIPVFSMALSYYGGTQEPFHFWGMGIRAIACGRAFVALSNDPSALIWNPSGSALLKNTEVLATYIRPFGNLYGTSYQNIVITKPMRFSNPDIPDMEKSMGTLSIGFALARSAEIAPTVELTKTNYSDFLTIFSYAKDISRKFSFGLSMKVRRMSIGSYSDTGFGFDIGALLIPSDNIHIGMKIENIKGAQIKLIKLAQEDEANLWLGGDITTRFIDLLGAININLSGDYTMHTGTIFKPITNIDIIGGYTTFAGEFTLGTEVRVSHIGIGYCLGLGHKLGINNMWSLRYIW
ncbi:MAG: hypothetical protein ACUVWP_08390 [bacterium]